MLHEHVIDNYMGSYNYKHAQVWECEIHGILWKYFTIIIHLNLFTFEARFHLSPCTVILLNHEIT